ncbi:MAG: hypothetical protein RLZZ292_979 [Bacteroidota bacterium]|jgi:hypothetical protein
MKKLILIFVFLLIKTTFFAQPVTKTMLRLPDTGQTTGFTNTFGEDNDYSKNVPFFINMNALITTDTVTDLMWQRTDGGEMTIENAAKYCDTLTLGGFTDWRLPTPHEAFSILNLQNNKPALDTKNFTKTAAEYWWSSVKQTGDATKVWCTNAGGGIGNHPKSETKSAGGTKFFHVRAVRDVKTPTTIVAHFTDNGDGTITDNLTNLVWQKTPNPNLLTWEDALKYAENLTFATVSDWRLPNIKEMQSINDESVTKPSVSTTFFPTIGVKKYWSSTSLPNQTTKAWYLDTQFGITTYDEKTVANSVLCVRYNTKTTTNQAVLVEEEGNIRVFPNPNNGILSLQLSDNLPISDVQNISIFDLKGGLIYQNVSFIEKIDLKNVAHGVYIIKIQCANGLIVKKVVIEN